MLNKISGSFLGIILLGFICVSPSKIFAVTITINDSPPSITEDIFNVTASISGAATGTNYLRVDLYKDGTNNYFGETYNGSDWYSGSDGLQYFPISVTKGSTASATVQARIGNPSSSDFPGNGSYKLKLRRYTSSGSYASTDDQSPVDISIVMPTFTPTPAPSPIPTSTSTPTNTSTPTIKLISVTSKPSVILSSSLFPTGSSTSPDLNFSPSATPSVAPVMKAEVLGESDNNLSRILIGTGGVLLVSCAILGFWSYRKNKTNEV